MATHRHAAGSRSATQRCLQRLVVIAARAHRAHHRAELLQRAVVLRAAEKTHLAVGHLVRRERLAHLVAVRYERAVDGDLDAVDDRPQHLFQLLN